MTSDLSRHSLARIISEDDYVAALGRVSSGQHTDDDLNLIRAWAERQEQDRAATLSKLHAYFGDGRAAAQVA